MSSRKSYKKAIIAFTEQPPDSFETHYDELEWIKNHVRIFGKRLYWTDVVPLFTQAKPRWWIERSRSDKVRAVKHHHVHLVKLELGISKPYHVILKQAFAASQQPNGEEK